MGETTGPDDVRKLMVRYQSGDAQALEELVRKLSPSLLRYFGGSGLIGEAEDLLQEYWIQIHRSRHTYRPSDPPMPWIFAIARHVRLDGYRRKRRRESREVLVGDLPDRLQPESQRLPAEDDIELLLGALPDSQREVLLMLKVFGMSLEEVARATSSTVGAVKQKAHRAYVSLRQVLENRKYGR
jgi:RNA polymerase sigma-70 factor (ECF subfamily)